MSTLCILGRQPAIGLAELESLFGADALRVITPHIVEVAHPVTITRLGGSIKTAEVLAKITATQASELLKYCKRELPTILHDLPEGKTKLGVDFYGLEQNVRTINAFGLELKKIIKQTGRSVRVVPNQSPELSSAQTFHNQLTSPLGLEFIFVKHGTQILIARVNGVRNIEAYTERDRGQPKRDTRIGMLPPKLAQTIINLAVGNTAPATKFAVLDPFCGTGVILQEALIMGFSVIGTDIDPRMIDYTNTNVREWLPTKYPDTKYGFITTFVGDATALAWSDAYAQTDNTSAASKFAISAVACESYLGTPFASEPSESTLKDSMTTCNLILKKFLKNIYSQTEHNTQLCVAVPAWFVRGRIHHLPMIQQLEEIGYRRVTHEHASFSELIYHREDQIVGRELLVLVRT